VIIVDELGFAPVDDTSTQLLFRSSPPPTNAGPSLNPPIGVGRSDKRPAKGADGPSGRIAAALA